MRRMVSLFCAVAPGSLSLYLVILFLSINLIIVSHKFTSYDAILSSSFLGFLYNIYWIYIVWDEKLETIETWNGARVMDLSISLGTLQVIWYTYRDKRSGTFAHSMHMEYVAVECLATLVKPRSGEAFNATLFRYLHIRIPTTRLAHSR